MHRNNAEEFYAALEEHGKNHGETPESYASKFDAYDKIYADELRRLAGILVPSLE